MNPWHRASWSKRVWLVVCACAALASGACSSLPVGGNGDSCERSAQCKAGLVCVQHECTGDLSMIGDQSMVPDFGMNDGDAAALGDASVRTDAASTGGTDASTTNPMLDAATGVDSATPNLPMVDAANDDDAG
jgi:hypothetical protein